MSDYAVNHVLERIMTDETLFRTVAAKGQSALAGYGLTDLESAQIAAAVTKDVRADARSAFATLRTLARIDHLFGAASAAQTKSG
jgi:hypothetical protein